MNVSKTKTPAKRKLKSNIPPNQTGRIKKKKNHQEPFEKKTK